MSTKYFNFNNERALTEIEVNDETGVVELVVDGEVVDFESVTEFAEYYALSRNVVAENLKNWTLTQDGNQVAFVLKAGTAGLTEDEIVALVRALRIAGMGPEEIGVVLAQQTAAAGAPVERAVAPAETEADQLRRVIDTLSPLAKFYLAYANDTDPETEALVEALVGEGYTSYEDDDDSEYYGENAIRYNINDAVSYAIDDLADDYPLPAVVAVQVAVEARIDSEVAVRQELLKAIAAGKVARRKVHVFIYSDEAELENQLVDAADVNRLSMAGYELYADGKKFYFVG